MYRNRKLKLLVDTGASINQIFKENIDNQKVVKKDRLVKVKGISKIGNTLDILQLSLQIEKHNIKQEFYVMENFIVGVDSIVSADFLRENLAIVNYRTYVNKTYTCNRQQHQST